MASTLTQAGRRLIGEYLDCWSQTRDWMLEGKNPDWAPLKLGTDREGRSVLLMSLPNGDGACAATTRKLVRDGFAVGQYSWTNGRYLAVTDAGVAAYLTESAAS